MPNSRCLRFRRDKAFLLLALATCAAPARSQLPATWFGSGACASLPEIVAQEHDVLLHVRLHEADPGSDEVLRVRPGGVLLADVATLARWRIDPPDGSAGPHALESIAGLRWRYDPCLQELLLDMRGVRRATHRARVPDNVHEPQPATQPGAFLNADVQWIVADHETHAGALLELGAFAGRGHGVLSGVVQDEQVLRLDTAWVLDDPANLRRLSLGDAIARPAPGRRAVRFGGISWGTEWALQPDLVRFPLPAVRGDAALPSTVEVYVDNVLRAREEVPAGAFEIDRLPTLGGAGTMQIVVRDALGRSHVASQGFYAAPELLREGLSEFGLDAGFLRQSYGARSDDYGEGFAAGAWRRGLFERLTVGAQAEAGRSRVAGGAGLTVLAPALGVFSAAFAASRSDSGTGTHLDLSLERRASAISAGASLELATRDFRGLGENASSPRTVLQAHAGLVALGGSVSLTGVLQDRFDEGRVRILALGYGRRLAQAWSFSLQLGHLDAGADEWSGTVSLGRSFGSQDSVSFETDRASAGHAVRGGWQHEPQTPRSLGWRAGLETGRSERFSGQLRRAFDQGAVQADAELGDRQAARVSAQTGLALLGGDVFWTAPVSGSFAVVRAGAAPGVRVLRDNQWVTTTGSDGRALVPNLRPYERNRISVMLSDLPIEARLDDPERTVVPYARSAIGLDFGVIDAAPRRLRVRLADGTPLPSGAEVSVARSGARALVGIDGLVLVEGLPRTLGANLEARWHGGECRAELGHSSGGALDEEVVTCAPRS